MTGTRSWQWVSVPSLSPFASTFPPRPERRENDDFEEERSEGRQGLEPDALPASYSYDMVRRPFAGRTCRHKPPPVPTFSVFHVHGHEPCTTPWIFRHAPRFDLLRWCQRSFLVTSSAGIVSVCLPLMAFTAAALAAPLPCGCHQILVTAVRTWPPCFYSWRHRRDGNERRQLTLQHGSDMLSAMSDQHGFLERDRAKVRSGRRRDIGWSHCCGEESRFEDFAIS